MIRLSFRITWPALFLIAFALIAWLLRYSRQAQARPVPRQTQPATRPEHRSHSAPRAPRRPFIVTPDGSFPGHDAAEHLDIDSLDRDVARAAERGYQAAADHDPYTEALAALKGWKSNGSK